MPARTESRFIEISDNIIFGGSRGKGNERIEGEEGVVEEELARVDGQGGRAGRVHRSI